MMSTDWKTIHLMPHNFLRPQPGADDQGTLAHGDRPQWAVRCFVQLAVAGQAVPAIVAIACRVSGVVASGAGS
ncbi:MAG: hypothetical protein R3E68_14100 [Burkholderiaceae bacterium]